MFVIFFVFFSKILKIFAMILLYLITLEQETLNDFISFKFILFL